MNDYASLVVGVVSAGIGGELFVRGTVGLARWARISPGVIGATVAAFATSSPELSVAVIAATAGKPQISLGDALGSNVVNVALILALALVISGIQTPRDSVKRDFPVALLVPVMTAILFLDGVLSRFDGILMLSMFLAWIAAVIAQERKRRTAGQEFDRENRGWFAILACAIGLVFLIVAGNFMVAGAKGIAVSFGIDEFIIGATIVAVGTSVPELATSVIAKLRGHDEIGLGTILGSNIFNGLFITGMAATICPISVAWREVAIAFVFGIMVVALAYPSRDGWIGRRRGVALLTLYVAYLGAIVKLGTGR